MATITMSQREQATEAGRGRAVVIILKWLLVLLGALVVTSAILAAWRLRRALPHLDGTIRVAGLRAPVEIRRDAHGVPHIRAQSLEDVFFAQGYVTAQDRLWQMDLSRRLARGRLAEILGPRALRLDIENRTLGFSETAERAVAELDPSSRMVLTAYTRGVNAFIETHLHRWPVEFALLRFQPRPWTEADSLGVALNMEKTLNTSWRGILSRERVRDRLSPQLYADLYPDHSPLDRPVAELPARIPANSPPRASSQFVDPSQHTDDDVLAGHWNNPVLAALVSPGAYFARSPFALGSNNWVVSGAHTLSGKPLLANDPHLGHSVPSVWYMIHLKAPGLDVAGVSLPGAPSVIIGHNARIAWGMTNTGPAVQDLFVETFNPANRNQYLHNGLWVNCERRDEDIKVRGQADVHLAVRRTRHGPIVSALDPRAAGGRELALEWTALQPRALTFPFLDIDEAENWQQFTEAIRNFTGPEQNMVYGDVDGNIGYYAPAWVPVRRHGDATVPVPGATDDFDWTSYIPFEDLPRAFNPPGGVVATANSRVVPDGYPYFITHSWAAPWRTARIFQLLEAGRKLTTSDMLRVQMDIYSLEDEWISKRLVAAAAVHPPEGSDARRAVEQLRHWDGQARADSAATLICERARAALLRRLLQPKLGDDTGDYHWSLSLTFVANVFDNNWTRWLPPGDPDFNATLVHSLEDAVKEINSISGADAPSGSSWGATIPLTFHHPLDHIPLIGTLFDLGPFPQQGMATTIKAVTPTTGPSMRLVVDFANLDRSLNNITLGESGELGSPYYRDQFRAWYGGTSFPMPFSDAAVDASTAHRLRLEP